MAHAGLWRSVTGRSLVEGSTVVVLLLLSWQLVALKRAHATLQGELERSTRSFVVGDSMPGLPIRLANGSRIQARGLCDGRRRLLLVVSSPACEYCRRLQPEWNALARRSDLAVLVVEPGSGPRSTSIHPGVLHATSEGSAIIEALRIREVPAAVLGDQDCRIRAAGAGFIASRSVLAQAAQLEPAPSVVSTFNPKGSLP